MNAQPTPIDDYWTHDTHLFAGVFRYYSRDKSKPQPVRARIHISEEHYYNSLVSEIIPLKSREGKRQYIMMQPYILRPQVYLTIGMYQKPKHYADQDDAIGEVVSTQVKETRQEQIGNSQVWYYPAEKTLVLWECFLESFVRDTPLLNDPNMKQLWTGFEEWLLKQFPQAVTIATPFSDPLFETQDYQQFLRSLGYEQGDKAAFIKLIK